MKTRGSAIATLVERGELPSAAGCWCHFIPGHLAVDYHPHAPRGFSGCGVCGRIVVRGAGRWWTR